MLRFCILFLALAACAVDPADESSVGQGIEVDPDCHLPSVILDDGFGTYLCLSGTGYFELTDYVHHWEAQPEPIGGGTHWVPVSWDGIAKSATTTFFYAAFYKDNASDYYALMSPQETHAFIFPVAGGPEVGIRPFSLTVF